VIVIVLELVGVTPSSMSFDHGAMIVRAWTIDLTPVTAGMIIGLSLATQIINTSFIAISTKRAQELAQNRVHAQTWHMKQLVPKVDR
jgi:hypothetical protein